MREFAYEAEGSRLLDREDLYRLFNNYRTWKYIMGMLIKLDKTALSEYRILEPGCGGGTKLRFLTELRVRPENCFGFDVSKRAMELAQNLSPSSISFQVASAMEIPFKDRTFDIVLVSALFNCFKDTHDIRKISKELRRVIKNDGVLLVIDITEHFLRYQPQEFAKTFKHFVTTQNELEGILSDEFLIFKRCGLFSAERYDVEANGTVRPADIPDLPFIDHSMDVGTGNVPCAYCLYSFLPRN